MFALEGYYDGKTIGRNKCKEESMVDYYCAG